MRLKDASTLSHVDASELHTEFMATLAAEPSRAENAKPLVCWMSTKLSVSSSTFREEMNVAHALHEEPSKREPVTLVEGRTLKLGHENDFHAWVQRTLAASEHFSGNQGVTILMLGKEPSATRYVIHRFADAASERAWMQSEERATLMQEAATFSTPYTQTASGLEAWFTLPDLPDATPPKWKLFLVTIPSAYLASFIVILILNAFLHGWSLLVTNGIVTVFLAFMLTYVGLPLSTRLLHSWLYPPEKGST